MERKQQIPIRGLRGGINTLDNHCRQEIWALVEKLVEDALNSSSIGGGASVVIADVIAEALENVSKEARVKTAAYIDALRK